MYLGKVYIYKGITRPYKLNLKYNTLERSYKIESQLNLFNKEELQLGVRYINYRTRFLGKRIRISRKVD